MRRKSTTSDRRTPELDHAFSDEAAARKMHQEFTQAEIDRRHVLLDPPDESNAIADLIVAALRGESLIYRSVRS